MDPRSRSSSSSSSSSSMLKLCSLFMSGLLVGFLLADFEVVRLFGPSTSSAATRTPLGAFSPADCPRSAVSFLSSLPERDQNAFCWTRTSLIDELAGNAKRPTDAAESADAAVPADQRQTVITIVPNSNASSQSTSTSSLLPSDETSVPLVPYQLPLFVRGGGATFLSSHLLREVRLASPLSALSVEKLSEMISAQDSPHIALLCARDQLSEAASLIDDFLTKHPNWWVYLEPYEWLSESENDAALRNGGSLVVWGLGRTLPELTPHLNSVAEVLAQRQFPNSVPGAQPKSCSDQRLWLYKEDIGRYYGSFLGVVSTELSLALSNDCQAVVWLDKRWYQIDVPSLCGTSGPNDAGPDPWQCLFMPISECPASLFYDKLPSPPGQVQAAGHAFLGPGGESVPFAEYTGLKADWLRPERRLPELEQVDAGQRAVFDGCEHSGHGFNLWWRTVLAKFISRPNYMTRSAVSRSLFESLRDAASTVDAAFQLHRLEDDERHLCVAVHVRHGDKLTELAQGVADRITFNHTLNDYLERAQPLLDAISEENGGRKANTVLLMSDDAKVQKQAAQINERFARGESPVRIFSLAGTGQPGELTPKARNDEFFSLLASMELLSHCQGVVGNFDSNISALLYQLIAYRHNKCPHFYSFTGTAWRQLGKRKRK